MEHPRARCDGCGGNLEPWKGPVIFDCFHALHASCASGSDACPRCGTPRTRPPVAGAAPSASPPDSSVAGAIGSDPSAGVEEEEGPPVIQCEECGGLFRPTDFWGDECPHCILRRGKQWRADPQRAHGSPSSPTWSSWTSFGSPERSPSPSDDVDEYSDIPTGAPSRYSDTLPFGQPPPPAPANPFQQPAQFALPPSTFQQYSDAVPFGQPPSAPANTFEPPALFAPPPPSSIYHGPVCNAAAHLDVFGPPPNFYRPLPPPPPPPYFYQRQPPPAPAPACSAYAPAAAASPYCAACGGAVVRGQTAVTSQCNHTFHFRRFAGSVYACPACGAQWGDVGPLIPPPPYRY